MTTRYLLSTFPREIRTEIEIHGDLAIRAAIVTAKTVMTET
jgi:hypothetical protein